MAGSAEAAEAVIVALLKERVEGISDREAEALALAKEWELDEDWLKQRWARAEFLARGKAKAAQAEAIPFFTPIHNLALREAGGCTSADGGGEAWG